MLDFARLGVGVLLGGWAEEKRVAEGWDGLIRSVIEAEHTDDLLRLVVVKHLILILHVGLLDEPLLELGTDFLVDRLSSADGVQDPILAVHGAGGVGYVDARLRYDITAKHPLAIGCERPEERARGGHDGEGNRVGVGGLGVTHRPEAVSLRK